MIQEVSDYTCGILKGSNEKCKWFLTLSSKNYAIWFIFECARAKTTRNHEFYFMGPTE